MTRLLRPFDPEDAKAFPLFAQIGVAPDRVPPPAWTGVVDGRPVLCFGIWRVLSKTGQLWLILGDGVHGHELVIARLAREILDHLLAVGDFHHLQATAVVGPKKPRKFLEFLGMHRHTPRLHKYGEDGRDHWLYTRWAP